MRGASIPRRTKSPICSPTQIYCSNQKPKRPGARYVKNLAGIRGALLLYDITGYAKLTSRKRQSQVQSVFCLEGSIKPESPWLVPLQGRKMPENGWKSVIHLFC